jgi:MFS family permease
MNPTTATLSLSMLLASLGTSIANVALPTLAHAFDASFQQVQWVVVSYLVAITVLVIGAGRLGDAYGRRSLLLAGTALFALGSVLCGAAPSLGFLVSARAVQGAGAAIMMALAMAIVGEAVPKEKTGSAMGMLGTTSAIGTALGPTLGGFLVSGFGWRAIFAVLVPLAALAFVLAHRYLPANRPFAKAPRAKGGATMRSVLGDRVSSAGFAMTALVTAVVMATLVVGPFHLSHALGLDAALVGLVMSSGPIVAALVGVPAGRIVDRLGTRRTVRAGLVAMAVGSLLLAIVPTSFGVPGYIAPLALVTAGYALFQAANNTAVMADVAPDRRGVVSGMLTFSRNLGLIAGASLMGGVFAAAGMRAAFGVAALLVGAALAIARIWQNQPSPCQPSRPCTKTSASTSTASS